VASKKRGGKEEYDRNQVPNFDYNSAPSSSTSSSTSKSSYISSNPSPTTASSAKVNKAPSGMKGSSPPSPSSSASSSTSSSSKQGRTRGRTDWRYGAEKSQSFGKKSRRQEQFGYGSNEYSGTQSGFSQNASKIKSKTNPL